MKIKYIKFAILIFLASLILSSAIDAQTFSLLDKEFNLGGAPSQEAQYFLMETKLLTYTPDGARSDSTIFRLRLRYLPAKTSGKENGEYTCIEFTIQKKDSPQVAIPALKDWSYAVFDSIDSKGQLFGIDHSKFEGLKDGNGHPLPPGIDYHVYNTFIDFHSFSNVFAARTAAGAGIQNLKKICQKIVHSAAFSEPPVNLGSNVSEGSYFKNGKITLEFKGLSVVYGRPCALIGYDSGESSFKMIMNPAPNFEINTTGSSHYMGDIYKDLKTNWVQKVTMSEFVVSQTKLPMPPNEINAVNERYTVIRNVSEKAFSSEWSD